MSKHDKKLDEVVRKYRKAYNNLPETFRVIAGLIILKARLDQLNSEKARLEVNYTRSLNHINKQVRTIEKMILKHDRFEIGKDV